jgi:hypothetical protein
VIGVTQNHLGAGLSQLRDFNTFDGALSANGHKRW